MTKSPANADSLSPHAWNAEAFRHWRLLLYWPVFGLLFFAAERLYTPKRYHMMHCVLDDHISFCEWFLLPYLFWFVFLLGMHLYTLLRDPRAFRRMMYFIMLTYSAALLAFFLFPTVQQLRPAVFPRDNVLTRLMAAFYGFDTNTNVCPSLHVVGSLAVLFAAWDCPRFRSRGWRRVFGLCAFFISISTVFLKQHSVLDILAALLLCAAAYRIVYQRAVFLRRRSRRADPCES